MRLVRAGKRAWGWHLWPLPKFQRCKGTPQPCCCRGRNVPKKCREVKSFFCRASPIIPPPPSLAAAEPWPLGGPRPGPPRSHAPPPPRRENLPSLLSNHKRDYSGILTKRVRFNLATSRCVTALLAQGTKRSQQVPVTHPLVGDATAEAPRAKEAPQPTSRNKEPYSGIVPAPGLAQNLLHMQRALPSM